MDLQSSALPFELSAIDNSFKLYFHSHFRFNFLANQQFSQILVPEQRHRYFFLYRASVISRCISCPVLLYHFLSCLPKSVRAIHYHLASSNQCLAIRPRLIIKRADYWGEVARVVFVELCSRVYDVICLPS